MDELYKKIDLTQQFFFRSLAKEMYEDDDITAWYSGIDNKNFNNVIHADIKENNIDNALLKVKGFYRSKNVPWSWILTPFNKPTNIEDFLLKAGLKLLYTCNSMVYHLESLKFTNLPEGYNIKEVTDMKGMTDWIIVLNEGFGAEKQDDMSFRDLNMRIPYGGNNAFHHYVCYIEEEPVSAGTLSVSKHGARIDNIATKPSHFRKGLGSAITLYVMQEAKKLGFSWCCLDASDEGFLMYKKLGFNECYESKIYG